MKTMRNALVHTREQVPPEVRRRQIITAVMHHYSMTPATAEALLDSHIADVLQELDASLGEIPNPYRFGRKWTEAMEEVRSRVFMRMLRLRTSAQRALRHSSVPRQGKAAQGASRE